MYKVKLFLLAWIWLFGMHVGCVDKANILFCDSIFENKISLKKVFSVTCVATLVAYFYIIFKKKSNKLIYRRSNGLAILNIDMLPEPMLEEIFSYIIQDDPLTVEYEKLFSINKLFQRCLVFLVHKKQLFPSIYAKINFYDIPQKVSLQYLPIYITYYLPKKIKQLNKKKQENECKDYLIKLDNQIEVCVQQVQDSVLTSDFCEELKGSAANSNFKDEVPQDSMNQEAAMFDLVISFIKKLLPFEGRNRKWDNDDFLSYSFLTNHLIEMYEKYHNNKIFIIKRALLKTILYLHCINNWFGIQFLMLLQTYLVSKQPSESLAHLAHYNTSLKQQELHELLKKTFAKIISLLSVQYTIKHQNSFLKDIKDLFNNEEEKTDIFFKNEDDVNSFIKDVRHIPFFVYLGLKIKFSMDSFLHFNVDLNGIDIPLILNLMVPYIEFNRNCLVNYDGIFISNIQYSSFLLSIIKEKFPSVRRIIVDSVAQLEAEQEKDRVTLEAEQKRITLEAEQERITLEA